MVNSLRTFKFLLVGAVIFSSFSIFASEEKQNKLPKSFQELTKILSAINSYFAKEETAEEGCKLFQDVWEPEIKYWEKNATHLDWAESRLLRWYREGLGTKIDHITLIADYCNKNNNRTLKDAQTSTKTMEHYACLE